MVSIRKEIDLFLAETLGSAAEAELFLTEFIPTGRPVWLSVTLEDVDVIVGQPRLRSGEPLSDVLALFQTQTADALLFNCSQPAKFDGFQSGELITLL